MSTTAPTDAPRLNLRELSRLRWLDVDSSAVERIAYDGATESLYVQLRNAADRYYAYRGVANDVFLALVTAPSHGSYFARYIRNEYPAERVDFAVQAVQALR